ncbi:Feruloyl CoA ortho-hydroxylase 1-like protein [Drosera capensis]
MMTVLTVCILPPQTLSWMEELGTARRRRYFFLIRPALRQWFCIWGRKRRGSRCQERKKTKDTIIKLPHQLEPCNFDCFAGEHLSYLLESIEKELEVERDWNKSLPDKLWLKQQFAVGVNEVARVLGRMPPSVKNGDVQKPGCGFSIRLQAVFVAWDCNPRWLIRHLPSLAASRDVPIFFVKDHKQGLLPPAAKHDLGFLTNVLQDQLCGHQALDDNQWIDIPPLLWALVKDTTTTKYLENSLSNGWDLECYEEPFQGQQKVVIEFKNSKPSTETKAGVKGLASKQSHGYFCPEDQAEHHFSSNTNSTIPLIDLGATRDAVVEQICGACEEWSFFQVVNHGVPEKGA